MQTAYKAVGIDFEDKEEFIGSEYHKLLRLEAVPRRWPLARLSIPLQIVDHLDRVLAGCCWEAFATRAVPEESLPSIKQSKLLTMLLAGYLAKEVAAILKEILTHPTKKLYDDTTEHLLWLQLLASAHLPEIVALIVAVQCNGDSEKEQALQWTGKGICTSSTTENLEANCYRYQIS